MTIETEIKGSPGSIEAAADWLKSRLGTAIDTAGNGMADARRDAGADWDGDTSEAFQGAMKRGATEALDFHSTIKGISTCFSDYAGTLRSCQSDMADIRDKAGGGGLAVHGMTIADPGAGPSRPGEPAPGADVAAHNAQVDEYNAHQDKVRLYNRLSERADGVWGRMKAAWDEVTAKDRGINKGTLTTAADIAGGLAGAVGEFHGSILKNTADTFAKQHADDLARLKEQANSGRSIFDASKYYDDFDTAKTGVASTADDLTRAGKALRLAKGLPLAAGGALSGVGIWYDMKYGGESGEQAAVSNLGGFAASVGAGAVVGTMIGGPVGTAVGVVVGAGVGIFTSGMLDGLWDHDGNVGKAFVAGLDAVGDTGADIADAAGDVGGAIVDGFESVF
ncbi:MAG: hypothetical protein ACRDPS_09555 [Nocardioides sp.]|uniref:hypothetical protein n=1 Tax=Nocardioides sp. TaxID=35761 RepID=UPI003D6A55E4